MSAIDVDQFRERLLAERERVASALDRMLEDNTESLEEATGELNSSSADNHLADTATETFDRELESGLEEASERLLAEIDAALERIEQGTYGSCEVCGKPIDPERLEAVPWTTLCIDDKRRRERG
jgi:DnaK suppressor protein